MPTYVPKVRTPKKRGCLTRIAIWIFFGFIGLVILGAVINGIRLAGESAGILPTRTPTSTPTITPTPTNTPIPTDTPLPTDTPVPTATPTITNTPLPTDTPYPTETVSPLSTDVPLPTDAVVQNNSIQGNDVVFGEPVLFNEGGFSTIAVLVTNNSALVKSFTAKATYKNGEQIVAVAVGAVNDLLPGQTRAVMLATQDKIPVQYNAARVEVDTMIIEQQSTPGSDAATKLEFGQPSISNNGLAMINVEVTNRDATPHSFTVQAIIIHDNKLVGYAVGAMNDLGSGQTKTASLIAQGETNGSITIAAETVVK